MTGRSSSDETVLVVEDERALADLYADWLDGRYDVRTAYDGSEALSALDAAVEVVLLDRRLPSLSGDEFLATLRERGYDSRVVIVSAVEPDFDIVEMAFDDYLVKPVTREDLYDAVERMLTRRTYDDRVQEYYALASKKAALDAEKSDHDRANSAEYESLTDRLRALREEVDDAVVEFEDRDFIAAFKDLDEQVGDEG